MTDTGDTPEAAQPCTAVLYHGPGHQSRTYCQEVEQPHALHWAEYGEFRQRASWRGPEAMTDFFDNPKEAPDD
jgi:hypothetical protein